MFIYYEIVFGTLAKCMNACRYLRLNKQLVINNLKLINGNKWQNKLEMFVRK